MSTEPSLIVGDARVNRPHRDQIEWRPVALDDCVPSDHRVRLVWRYVESLDLSPLYQQIRAVEGEVGRNAIDPKILMALWLFATIEGISSARQLARLCERDLVYQWICGGVGVNHHRLSDFLTDHTQILDSLLTDTVATLIHQGLVTLNTVGQDGMRVRANAGSSSFRREATLKECRQAAQERVEQLRAEREDESLQGSSEQRRQAAQERAAVEREERIERALAELKELQQQKEKRKKGTGKDARASTTDPEARKMKMGDGGYRPAYNVQFATDGDARLIVGVEVTNSGSDRGQMAPMHETVGQRYHIIPEHYLIDCGFFTNEDITTLEQRGSKVYAPIRGEDSMRKKGTDPHARQKKDTDETYAFRQRMATEEAKARYKQRPAIAEFPNAECRNRGLYQFRVRGLEKVKAVALWHGLTFNLMRMIHLGYIT